MLYTEPRYTKNIDIVVGNSEGEAERVAESLAEFGFLLSDAQVDKLREPAQMIVSDAGPIGSTFSTRSPALTSMRHGAQNDHNR